jgi:nitrate/nitrite transporter NarK
MKKRVLKVFWNTVGLILFGFVVWMFVSFIDVNIHNGDLDPDYPAWNFFEIAHRSGT